MIRKINNSLPGNNNRAVTKVGIATVEQVTWSDSIDINVTGVNRYLEPDIGFFSTSGTPSVTTGGSLLFNCEGGAGALVEGEVVNQGSTGFYVGFNSVTPFAGSGTFLDAGDTLTFGTVPIRQIWVISANGSSFVSAWGNYNRNFHGI
jgi:hypothetical protein